MDGREGHAGGWANPQWISPPSPASPLEYRRKRPASEDWGERARERFRLLARCAGAVQPPAATGRCRVEPSPLESPANTLMRLRFSHGACQCFAGRSPVRDL